MAYGDFVNSTALTIGTAASTWSIPTNSSIEGGAAFVVGLGPSSGVTVSTITDNTTNVYRLAARCPSPRPAGAELWWTAGISSASTRISVTLSGASSGSIAVGQFRGLSTANARAEFNSSAINVNSTTHGSGEITSSGLCITYARLNASTLGLTKEGAGWSTWTDTGAAVRSFGMYQLNAGPTTVSGAFTTDSNAQHASVSAIFVDTATAPVWQSVGTSPAGNLDNVVVTAPSGIADGDILLAEMYAEPSTQIISPPAGFSSVVAVTNEAANFRMEIYWKRAAGESGNYTFTESGNTWGAGSISRISGAISTGNPINVVGTGDTGSGLGSSASAITPTLPESLLIFLQQGFNGIARTPPAGMDENVEAANGAYWATVQKASSGGTGKKVAALASTETWTCVLLAIDSTAPAVGGGGGFFWSPTFCVLGVQ